MAQIDANGITLEYEITGSGPPLMLVMGLAGQLTDWPQPFVDMLAQRFTVVRFDNRDIGLSTKFDHVPVPSRLDFLKAFVAPSRADSAYRIPDMAADAAALLDGLGIDRAHVVGMSMGGMIVQQMAIDHPERVASLCSVMSNTGNRRTGMPKARIAGRLARRVDPPRDEVLDLTLDFFELIGGRDWDREDQRARTVRSLERSYHPDGMLRQSLAIATSPDRTRGLGSVSVPTLVVHGLDDPLVVPSGGVSTANAVPHSRLIMYPRMGHDIPATRHVELVEEIADNAARANVPAFV